MNYDPSFLNFKTILTTKEKEKLHNLSSKIEKDFLKNFRNIEEFGIDFVFNSSQLEGNTYDRFDTETLIKMGQTAGGKKFSDAVMILNLREAFSLIMKNLDQEINKDFIKDLHFVIADKLVPQGMAGIVRQHSVKIGLCEYKPLTNPQQLENELNYLINISQKYEDPFEKALYLHNNLSYLQYFTDCNKRTARNVMAFSLIKENLFPCLFSLSNPIDYSKSIVNYYETGNYDQFKNYFINSYEKTIQNYDLNSNNEIEIERDMNQDFSSTINHSKNQIYKKR